MTALSSPEVSLVADCKCSLGEGPLWAFGRVFWFDINQSELLSCWPDGGDLQRQRLPARASAAMPAPDGTLVVACDQGLAQCKPNGENFSVFAPLENELADNRSNDGKGDPDGNFWVGTMSHSHVADAGSIYRCARRPTVAAAPASAHSMEETGEGGGDEADDEAGIAGAGVDIRRVFSPLSTPNCIAFSPDGQTMWWTDTRKRVIWTCALAPDSGAVGPARVFADLTDWRGKPDGAACDAEGFLWVALWDGGRVVRFAPDGRLAAEVPLPVSRPTCPVFGGEDLRTVFVTSASEKLSAAELREQPTAGGLFSFRTEAAGLPSPVFGRRGYGGGGHFPGRSPGPGRARPAARPATVDAGAGRGKEARYPSLRGRPVLISGGASGIGEALVRGFARQEAKTAFVDIQAERGEALAAELRLGGCAVAFRACDLRDVAALRTAAAELAAEVGDFQALVNNAANDQRHKWEETTPEYWDERIAVNLRHAFFLTQAAAPMMMRAGGGSIVNFGSTSWMLAQGGMPGYTAAKAAVHGMTRSFARDLGAHGIRVNTVVPGWVMTERQKELWLTPEAERDMDAKMCLRGQRVRPEDIANMVMFLCADDSAMCSAQNFIVDGGWL